MAMAQARPGRQARARARQGLLTLPAMLLAGGVALAVGYIAYVLWPRWPAEPVALDAPSIPVTVGSVTFNVPPAAIRRPVQRRPGTQERIDLAYLWPSLEPPDPAARPEPVTAPGALDRVFVTVAVADGLTPAERIRTIYPRYLDSRAAEGFGGLAVQPFRAGTPYQGEELILDPAGGRFAARCSQNGPGPALGICLYERRIGDADVTVRFPRDWLSDWRGVEQKLDRLIAQFHATGG
ncbi:MAG TPA: hypothetical protein VHA55_01695 [Pseudorhodoplanes sp.]|jgi:hypothetical protein|nr:hypothetical protein [Pseudorhodoplanes sp.]